VSHQDKYRLIPGGEDLPYTLRVALRATNQVGTLDYFSFAKSVIRGQAQLSNYDINETTNIGAAVCSSIISPEDYRYFVNNGATALSNSASLTIFKGSRMFSWQQKSLARFMAISNSRYFMQSANGSRAYILNNNGDTVVEKYGINTASATVYNNSKRTPYTFIGEWLVFIGALLALGGLAQHVIKKRQAIGDQKLKKATKKSPKTKAKRYNKG
jgi:apolipoprotein N-acyltransferase